MNESYSYRGRVFIKIINKFYGLTTLESIIENFHYFETVINVRGQYNKWNTLQTFYN